LVASHIPSCFGGRREKPSSLAMSPEPTAIGGSLMAARRGDAAGRCIHTWHQSCRRVR
jgi:hypothetical protein